MTDITSFTPKHTAFEIRARGLVTKEDKENFKCTHTFCYKTFLIKLLSSSKGLVGFGKVEEHHP